MLSKKDKQILRELDLNPRRSNTQIAKALRMSKETLGYRIKRMVDEGVIEGMYSIIDYFKLDSKIFKVLLRYQNLGEKGELEMVRWLKSRPEVIWVGKTDSKWDLIFSIRETSITAIYDLLLKFNTKFSKNIAEKQMLICYELDWLNEKYLYDSPASDYSFPLYQSDAVAALDKIDHDIIDELEHNARAPLIDIAKRVRLTAEAVAKRIKNLQKKGVLRHFKVRINFEKIDKGYHHFYIALKDFAKIKAITDYYKQHPKCIFIMKYHGHYDLHVELISDSLKEFRSIIAEFREKFGDVVADYAQATILSEFKLLQ